MAALVKRWYRSRRCQVLVLLTLLTCLIYYTTKNEQREANLDITRRSSVIEYIEGKLQEALKLDKGTGCEIPRLDPFAVEVTKFNKNLPKVVCQGKDWVNCSFSECKVKKEILDTTNDIICTYSDIIYESDQKYHIGSPVDVYGDKSYTLSKSDHVKVKCTGRHMRSILPSKWLGVAIGFRDSVRPKPPPPKREDTYNVLIFGFDSTAKNGFIRRMPKSYKYLVEELKVTVLNGYNIVGDGTPAALFPILTGKTELEMPDVRKKGNNKNTLDTNDFIFSKMKEDGYRTAYFEDSPYIGTFQYRFNGFREQPADHYLRDFFIEDSKTFGKNKEYCVGATPRYQLMMDITRQFLQLDGKKFIFSFIADITHNDFNQITTADEDTVEFLKTFKNTGRTKDTLLFVMGDHGPRYADVRSTLQGRLEERLPLMAIRLPDTLVQSRPAALTALRSNADALTTPHDIHATFLDALEMRDLWNPLKVTGADLKRGLTLLEPVPRNRSCSEAAIEPHWCACVAWREVPASDPLHQRAANAFIDFINSLTESVSISSMAAILRNLPSIGLTKLVDLEPHWCAYVAWRDVPASDPLHQRSANAFVNFIISLTESVRSECIPRTLTSISWVMIQKPNEGVLSFSHAKDQDGYVGSFGPSITIAKQTYQVKITVGPGTGEFEASMVYKKAEDTFEIDIADISRTNKYNHEPDCIHMTHPHLNMFCYCRDQHT